MTTDSIRLFIFGLGYSAMAVARSVLADGGTVAGTVRSEEKRAEIADSRVEAHLFDRDRPLDDPARALAGATHILSSVPPDAAGDPVIDQHGTDIAVLAHGARPPHWIGYLSTTGVYGDRDGGWVDEASELVPTGPRGERRLSAERAWLALGERTGIPVHLFRLAGIYGPGRSALDTVRAGRARRIVKPGQVFSRIHVDDIVQVLRASMAHPSPGAAYNVCDDEAAPPQEVIAHACDLLGVAMPPLVPYNTANLSDMARSFYRDNKRVRNDRIKTELGIELGYPDYRTGLRALLYAGH